MPISADASSRNGTSWTTNTNTMSWSHTNAGNALVVHMATYDINTVGDQCTGIAFNGVSMTKLVGRDTDFESPYKQHTSSWILFNPSIGTFNIVASFSGTIDYMMAFADSYFDVSIIGADASGTATGNSTSPSITITTTANNCWLSGFCWSRASIPAAGSGTTENLQNVGALGASGDSNGDRAPGSNSLNWTASSGNWITTAVALAPQITDDGALFFAM